jgi:hypothetical protein
VKRRLRSKIFQIVGSGIDWKLIFGLSLFGLAMAIGTVFVIPSNVETPFLAGYPSELRVRSRGGNARLAIFCMAFLRDW